MFHAARRRAFVVRRRRRRGRSAWSAARRFRPRVHLGRVRRPHLARRRARPLRSSGWSTTCSSPRPPTPGRDDPLFRQGTAAFEARRRGQAGRPRSTPTRPRSLDVTGAASASRPRGAPAPRSGTAASRSSSARVCRTRCWFSTTGARPPKRTRCAAGCSLDSEQYVRDTKTVGHLRPRPDTPASAALDAQASVAFSHAVRPGASGSGSSSGSELSTCCTGLDHILFLLALIAGSRRLREVVLGGDDVHAGPLGDLRPRCARPRATRRRVVRRARHRPVDRGRRGVVLCGGSGDADAHATDLETAGDGHFSLDARRLDAARGGVLLRPRARARVRLRPSAST